MNLCQTHNIGVYVAAASQPKSPDSALLDGSITTIYDTEAVVLRSRALAGCTNLTSATFTVLAVLSNQNEFNGCSNLSEFIAPELVSVSNSNSFAGCTNLKIVNFPKLNSASFYTAGYFEEVTLGTADVSGVIFEGNTHIRRVSLPNATTMSWKLVDTCSALEYFYAPCLPSVPGGGSGPFYKCNSLRTLQFGSPGHAVNSINSQGLAGVPASCNITIYTADGQPLTTNSPWGWTGNPTTDIDWRQA